jgi:hypothetical protein
VPINFAYPEQTDIDMLEKPVALMSVRQLDLPLAQKAAQILIVRALGDDFIWMWILSATLLVWPVAAASGIPGSCEAVSGASHRRSTRPSHRSFARLAEYRLGALQAFSERRSIPFAF